MPIKPKTLRASHSKTRTLKQVKDSSRYRGAWPTISRHQLMREPVCHCDKVRVWIATTRTERVEAMAEPDTIAPAVLVDHVRPLELGGDHDESNLQSLCRRC